MSSWEEFYSKTPKPLDLDENENLFQKFVELHVKKKNKIVLVTVSVQLIKKKKKKKLKFLFKKKMYLFRAEEQLFHWNIIQLDLLIILVLVIEDRFRLKIF